MMDLMVNYRSNFGFFILLLNFVTNVVEANHVDAAPAAPAPTLLSIKPTF
jgi:hypothetical protein